MKTVLLFALSTFAFCLARKIRFAVLLGAVALVVSAKAGAPLDQAARWRSAKVDPKQAIALDRLVERWRRSAGAYEQVQAMKANGVPAVVAFCLFYRKADNNMADSPAQGDPLTHRSRNVPGGRIPGKSPPYQWADAAFDAYYVVDRLDLCQWSDVQAALDKIESFNGFGYRRHGIAAPYLWAGTNLYTRGKYVSDGRFDPLAVDKELGVAAILQRMKERGISVPF